MVLLLLKIDCMEGDLMVLGTGSPYAHKTYADEGFETILGINASIESIFSNTLRVLGLSLDLIF